jgi:hypothetical protein
MFEEDEDKYRTLKVDIKKLAENRIKEEKEKLESKFI